MIEKNVSDSKKYLEIEIFLKVSEILTNSIYNVNS